MALHLVNASESVAAARAAGRPSRERDRHRDLDRVVTPSPSPSDHDVPSSDATAMPSAYSGVVDPIRACGQSLGPVSSGHVTCLAPDVSQGQSLGPVPSSHVACLAPDVACAGLNGFHPWSR
jgi:hypothetical protein